MKRAGLLIAALMSAQPALAQKAANKDVDGHLFCYTDTVDLREMGDGRYKVDIVFEHRGDSEHAVYPAGGAKLFGPQDELRAYIAVNYQFVLGADGNPTGRPSPVRISISTGRFAGARLEPFESLSLQLKAGTKLSQPIALNSAYYTIALVGGEAGLPGSSNPYDSEWSEEEIGALAYALEHGERALILSQHGKEVARIPVPQIDIVPQRDRDFAWVRAAVPLLKQGKCPA